MASKNIPDGFWKERINVNISLGQAIQLNNGNFPTQRRLWELGFGGLVNGINKYHGGIYNIRKSMGFKLDRKEPNYWKKWENVNKELSQVILENKGDFPNDLELREMNYGILSWAISKYHGGMVSVRKKFGFGIYEKPKRYWKKWRNVKKELEKVVEKNNGKFPSNNKLVEEGYGSLSVAIRKYHEGMNMVRERIGYNEQMRDNLARDLEKMISKL